MSIKNSFLGTHTMGKAMTNAIAKFAGKKEAPKVEAPIVENKIAYAEAEKLGFVKSARALGRNAFEATCDLGRAIDSGSVWALVEENGQKFFVKQIDEAGIIVRKIKAEKSVKIQILNDDEGGVAPYASIENHKYKYQDGKWILAEGPSGDEDQSIIEKELAILENYKGEAEKQLTFKNVKAESLMEKIQHELISELEKNDKRDGMPFEIGDTLGGETAVYDFDLKEDLDEFKKDIGELGYEVVSVNAGVATVQKKRVEEAALNEKKVEAAKEVKAEVLPYSADEINMLVEDVHGFYGITLDDVQTKELADILFNKEKEAVDKGELFTDFDWKATVESFLSSKEEKKEIEAEKKVVAEEKPEEQVFNSPEEATAYLNDKRKTNAIPTDKIYEPQPADGGKYKLVQKTASVEKKAEESVDEDAANELYTFAVNDGDLYRQMLRPIQKNLINKKASGIYNPTLALKAFMNFMQLAAQKYTKEYATENDKWYDLFPVEVRKAASNKALKDFETEAELGNYDNYLHKKYQKKPSAPTPEVAPAVEADMNKEGSRKVKAEDEETETAAEIEMGELENKENVEPIKLSFYSTDESTGGKYYLDENDNVYKTVEGIMYECTDEGEPLVELKAPYEIIETEIVEE